MVRVSTDLLCSVVMWVYEIINTKQNVFMVIKVYNSDICNSLNSGSFCSEDGFLSDKRAKRTSKLILNRKWDRQESHEYCVFITGV